MNIVFMGTPDFAVPSLAAIHNSRRHNLLCVITQPDKPKGRGYKEAYSPIKKMALDFGLKVLQPSKARDNSFVDELSAVNADIFVVAAYGQILPERILNIPPKGSINVHASLLPKYRGASPIQHAILNGDKTAGVTIMQMRKGIDTGEMLLKKELPVLDSDTGGSLHDKLSELGSIALIETLDQIEDGLAVPIKQDDELSTYAPLLTKGMGEIDWNKSSKDIVNLIRGLNPWPVAYTYLNGEIIKIWSGIETNEEYSSSSLLANSKPGDIIKADKQGIVVKTGDSAVLIKEVQGANSRRMSSSDYILGHRISPSDKMRQTD